MLSVSPTLYLLNAIGPQKLVLDYKHKLSELQATLQKAIAVEDYDRAAQVQNAMKDARNQIREV